MLTVTFPFKRRMGYYIIQVYIPCIFLVMLSWIVFWMRPDDSASRLTVGITTILTIVFLLGYTNGMLPKVREQSLFITRSLGRSKGHSSGKRLGYGIFVCGGKCDLTSPCIIIYYQAKRYKE